MNDFPRGEYRYCVDAKEEGCKSMTIKVLLRVDFAKLPSGKFFLVHHIKRMNYMIAQFKQPHITMSEIPNPIVKK